MKFRPRLTRDGLLLIAGLAGIIHETLLQKGAERPSLLVVFAAMIGLPALLRRDDRNK